MIVGYDYRLSVVGLATRAVWVQVLPDPLVGEWIQRGCRRNDRELRSSGRQAPFEVRAVDDAGAADQTPARREFICNPQLAGPRLYIGSNIFGSFEFRGPVWRESANDAIPIFAGERLQFGWVASGQDYGGQILGYRHAYDDTSTWPAWSIFDTRFEVAPELGGHSLYISALDNSNVQTRARIRFDVVEATLDEYILIVDDWDYRRDTWPVGHRRRQDGVLRPPAGGLRSRQGRVGAGAASERRTRRRVSTLCEARRR